MWLDRLPASTWKNIASNAGCIFQEMKEKYSVMPYVTLLGKSRWPIYECTIITLIGSRQKLSPERWLSLSFSLLDHYRLWQ